MKYVCNYPRLAYLKRFLSYFKLYPFPLSYEQTDKASHTGTTLIKMLHRPEIIFSDPGYGRRWDPSALNNTARLHLRFLLLSEHSQLSEFDAMDSAQQPIIKIFAIWSEHTLYLT